MAVTILNKVKLQVQNDFLLVKRVHNLQSMCIFRHECSQTVDFDFLVQLLSLVVIIKILNMEQPKILVAIRKRPLSKKEGTRGETDIISVKNSDTVIVSQYKQKVDLTKFLEETIFNFDFAFDENTHNEEIYQMAVRPLVESAFQGAKVTCFAYGQTGSGKTYTMNGNISQGNPGLYTLGANEIFQYLASPQFRHLKAKLSFYQIYCGRLYDLLNKRAQLKLREDNKNNINIIGLQEASVSSSEQFSDFLAQGSKERVTSQNSANADSSRSHAILQISLKDGKKLFGKISFIDLAGNERGADHMDMDKQTRIDGAEINKSLLSLKQCIRALDQGKGHTPFRGSKLTMVLKDSFIGFCRTVMIGNVSPSSASSQNTLNTLRYADRVKQLRKPQEGGTKQDLKAKQLMLPRQNKNAIRIMINNQDDAEDIAKKREDAQKEYGIVQEQAPKKLVKEENSGRKNSFNAGKGPQMVKETGAKSTSVAKNYAGNSLGNKQPMTNNLVGPGANLLANKNPINNPSINKGRGIGMEQNYQNPRPENQFGLQRYNSYQQGVIGKKEEPMDIESPTNPPYYLPNKNIANNNKFLQQGSNVQQGRMGGMNQSQNMSGNFSNLSVGNNMSLSQMNAPNVYGQPNRLNQGYNQQMQQQQQQQNAFYNNYNQQNFNQPNYNQQNYNPNNFPQQGKGNNYQNMSNFSNNFQNQNFNNNGNYTNRNQQQQQLYQLPENWEDLVTTIATSEDPEFNERIVAEMNQRLFSEEQQLMRNHSTSLRRQIDIIKSQMSLLNQMEVDKSKITSRGYVRFMQQSIQEKLSLLEQLREKLINFTYKLDVMEEIEGQRQPTSGHYDDEQLLDDIN